MPSGLSGEQSLSPCGAFVIVPFRRLEDAERWAEIARANTPGEPPVIVTVGAERAWSDPASGLAGPELEFDGGWRAKYAAGGTVVIARCDTPTVPTARERHPA